MYTASSVFLQSLADAGITHAFVNWGSDHPALLEDLERQRIQGDGNTKPEIVTCPNEMVALSAAQGYAQVTGKPAAVIVHVDVGTQVRLLRRLRVTRELICMEGNGRCNPQRRQESDSCLDLRWCFSVQQ
jgi:hypothetical protein